MNAPDLFLMFRQATDIRYTYYQPLGRAGYEPHLSLDYAIEPLTWLADGGPAEGSAVAAGNDNELALLAKFIGRPVDIIDQHGTIVWQGRFHSLTVPDGEYEHTLTLDDLANSIAMVYYKVNSTAESTGTRTQTDYEIDTPSMSAYGLLQSIVARGKMTADEAAQELKTMLRQRSKPAYGVQRGGAFYGQRQARLTFKGEWYYFGRVYYRDTSALETNIADAPDFSQNFGEGSGIFKIAQSFRLAPIHVTGNLWLYPEFEASQVTVQVGRVIEGAKPDDNLWCEIWENGWVKVGKLVCDFEPFPNYHGGGTDADAIYVDINGYVDARAEPYWRRVGTVFATLNGDGSVREKFRIAAIAGDPSAPDGVYPEDDRHVRVTVERGYDGTTAQSYGHGIDIYIELPKTPVAQAAPIPANSVATSVSEITFQFATPWTASALYSRWIVIYRTDMTDKVYAVQVVQNGDNYTSPPTVSFSGGGGSGATATAVLTDGRVTSVVVNNRGAGYTSAPSVSFSGGGGAGAAAYSGLGNRTWEGEGLYQIRMCTARTYARGEAYIFVRNSGTGALGIWRPPFPNDAKLWFKVSGTRETTKQLIQMVAACPFATFAHYEGAAGGFWQAGQGSQIYTTPARTGERSIQEEMRRLLERGTRDRFPMYAIIKPSRCVSIYREEDASAAMLWTLGGKLLNHDGSEALLLPPPVGRWVLSEGFRTGTTGPDKDNAFYVSEAQYDTATGELELRARTTPPLGQLPGVIDG